MANDKKDFYNIAELTEGLDVIVEKENANPNVPGQYRPSYLMVRQMRIQLAIAQQLSVVAGHLGRIVQAIEREQKK